MKIKLFSLLLIVIMAISCINSINASSVTNPNVYLANGISETSLNSVSTFPLRIWEHYQDSDKDFSYQVYVTKIMDDGTCFVIDEGSGSVDKTLQVPTTVTQIEVHFSGTTTLTFCGDTWWKHYRGQLNQRAYPKSFAHTFELSTKYRSWPNYNEPFIKVDGNWGAFNNPDTMSWGYGWHWNPN